MSAPVWIPQRSATWNSHQFDRLHKINEEGEAERATTFVPPHLTSLTIEQPIIQFSLNSSMEEKRAKLRVREKILNMTGPLLPHFLKFSVQPQGVLKWKNAFIVNRPITAFL